MTPQEFYRIQSRLLSLENQRRRWDEVDEVLTVPPVAGVATQTHVTGEENGVWLAPLDLRGVLRLRQASTVVETGTSDPPLATPRFGLALYRMEVPDYYIDKDQMMASARRPWMKVLELGTFAYDQDVSGRVELVKGLEFKLDAREGVFAVGWQSSNADCRWLCPNRFTASDITADIPFGASPDTGTGTAEYHVWSFYVPAAGTPSLVRAEIGCQSAGDTITVYIREKATGTTMVTLERTGLLAEKTASSAAMPVGWYDVYAKGSQASAAWLLRGGVVQWGDGLDRTRSELFRNGFKTRPLGSTSGDFPATLSVVGTANDVPLVVLRSALGVKRFGNFAYD